MNPLVLFFASGDSLYPGAMLIVCAVVLSSRRRSGWMTISMKIATWLGLAMVVMACPPFSFIVDLVFLIVFLLWISALNRARARSTWGLICKAASAILVVILVAGSAAEIFHRTLGAIRGLPSDHLVIIGDSISAGIDPQTPPWPKLLEHRTGIPVRNLSQPGAGVAEAVAMAANVTPQDTVVLIEIGGNDLLSGTSSAEFERSLQSLFTKIVKPGRAVVMFELPLLPHKIGFGRIQRRLAARYTVLLIPKHYLTSVISGSTATSDGLHLSAIGANRMASLVETMLAPALKPDVMR